MFHVTLETLDDSFAGGLSRLHGDPQIEQVTSLLALVERTHLGAKQLVEFVHLQVGGSFEPGIVDVEGSLRDAEDREMLTRVDLDLQPHVGQRREGCFKSVEEREAPLSLFPFWAAEPRIEGFAHGVDQSADRPRVALNEINVFRVARGRAEEQLVQCSATTKDDLTGNGVVAEHGDERP